MAAVTMANRGTEAGEQRRICEYSLCYWLCPASRWRRFEGHYVSGHPCEYADISIFSELEPVYCNHGHKDIA